MQAVRIIGMAALYVSMISHFGHAQDKSCPTDAKAADHPPETVYLDQNWDRKAAAEWYHLSQGTVFMPYEWFVSLGTSSGEGLFAATDNLTKYGFLADPQGEDNPYGLPIGFAVRKLDFPDNGDRQRFSSWRGRWVGLTCAACHTGQINIDGKQIRIDGGNGHVDIQGFTDAIRSTVAGITQDQTKATDFFTRVAKCVQLGGGSANIDLLKLQVATFAAGLKKQEALFDQAEKMSPDKSPNPGLGRLDASQRGGNFMLAVPYGELKNYQVMTAPVRYPMIWDTPYFDWVLYNASVHQPMARNVIEDLGTGAPLLSSTSLVGNIVHQVNMGSLVKMHDMVAELRSPLWPERIFQPINPEESQKGQAIFGSICAGCHQVIDRTLHRAASTPARLPSITVGLTLLDDIGTDPKHALNFANRMVTLERIGGGSAPMIYYKAAETLSGHVVEQWANESPENRANEQRIDAGRDNIFRGPLAYRSRPLNGIWATPPYLHNGSVANLYQLLLPASKRTPIFCVENWRYDPVHVGLTADDCGSKSSQFDATAIGNSNAGHEYGTDLPEADRMALLEYLKSL